MTLMSLRRDGSYRPLIAYILQMVMIAIGAMVVGGVGWFWAGSISRYVGMSESSVLAFGLWIAFAVGGSFVGWRFGQAIVRFIWRQ